MIKYLTKSTVEIRVENEEEADELHEQIQAEASKIGAILSSWTQTRREKKVKGEVIEEWFICKYVLTFNDPKAPTIELDKIDYKIKETGVFI